MKKKSSCSTQGLRADIGPIEIIRILPNRYADAVGPFVFLDHVLPRIQTTINKEGTGAHPHRGIATLTYILNGEDEHFDSAGNYAKVHSGGVQWMKAGKGIIHDETVNYDSQSDSRLIHAFQFWINLPSNIKAEKPEYLAIQGSEVPGKDLPEGNGWIKVIAGSFEDLSSAIPSYSQQFLYHVYLEPGATFTIDFTDKFEVAAYLPELPATINDEQYQAGDFIEFDTEAGSIELRNVRQQACNFILFGGEVYTEPIFAEGPFVMNSKVDTAIAYRDFLEGQYGKINYNKQRFKRQ
ncbi:pirin family protein [Chryseobacterium shandongense]|uniref:Pirin family protein n=1 Tax=Chryseobacterium shandongense TaxID=1493872 RepID=A0AAD0YBV0_9FLAO|nr:pirin family protein [Chryseobacterium shandongense]AZA85497.1 pirin family protein [Chryseobacterium shandongense]AZA97669.1 pirin family protein [Chryseobacterium shandongense]